MFLSEKMCSVESRKISLSEEEVVEGERASRTQSCQVLVFRLRCDKLSQLKHAVKSSLQQRALSPCKSGQGRGSSISLWERVAARYCSSLKLLQRPLLHNCLPRFLFCNTIWFTVWVCVCTDVSVCDPSHMCPGYRGAKERVSRLQESCSVNKLSEGGAELHRWASWQTHKPAMCNYWPKSLGGEMTSEIKRWCDASRLWGSAPLFLPAPAARSH